MKKCLLRIALLSLILTACSVNAPMPSNPNDSDGNESIPEVNPPTGSLFDVRDLINYRADINNAKALGIMKDDTGSSISRSVARACRGITSKTPYLVKSTSTIEHGNTNINDSQITSVTFKKITTDTNDVVIKGIHEGLIAKAATNSENSLSCFYTVSEVTVETTHEQTVRLVDKQFTPLTDWQSITNNTTTFTGLSKNENEILIQVKGTDDSKNYIDYEFSHLSNFVYSAITINTDKDHEYKLLKSDGSVIKDWLKSDTYYYTFDNLRFTDKSQIKIEKRVCNAVIEFFANENFEYTLMLDNETIMSGIKDNDANDKEPTIGLIRLENLLDGKSYNVLYEGKGREQVIHQDEIDAEIDKMYVSPDFTLVSYVPKGTSERPEELQIEKNESTNCDKYDLIDYFTDETRISFVISNKTGKIYMLPENKKFSVHNRTITEEEMGPVSLTVNNTNELEITQLVRNTTLRKIDYFSDIYGNFYLLNDGIDGIDPSNPKSMFFRWAGQYVPTKNGRVLKFTYKEPREYPLDVPEFLSVCWVGQNLNDEIPVTEPYVEIKYKPYNGWGGGYNYSSYATYECIEGDYLYTLSAGSWYNHGRFNIKTGEVVDVSLSTGGSYSGFVGHLDHKTIVLGWNGYKTDKTFALYAFDVFKDNDYNRLEYRDPVKMQQYVLLNEINYGTHNYSLYDDCFNPYDWEFRVDDFDKTTYYKICKDEKAIAGYNVVESGNYIAEEKKIILQPLN